MKAVLTQDNRPCHLAELKFCEGGHPDYTHLYDLDTVKDLLKSLETERKRYFASGYKDKGYSVSEQNRATSMYNSYCLLKETLEALIKLLEEHGSRLKVDSAA